MCGLQLGSTHRKLFNGCIENVILGSEYLLDRWCSYENAKRPSQSDGPRPPPPGTFEALNMVEPVHLDEGSSVTVRWKNIYSFQQQSDFDSSNDDISFRVLEGPQHGSLLMDGVKITRFTKQNILTSLVTYSHDGSETTEDSIDLQVEQRSKSITSPRDQSAFHTISVRIKPINDAPELKLGDHADTLRIAEGGRTSKKGYLRLMANDGDKESNEITIHVVTVPIEIHLKVNAGLKVLHQSSELITSQNLSFQTNLDDIPVHFQTNLDDIPVQYTIVDLPEYGIVECSDAIGQYRICSTFLQSDIDRSRIRITFIPVHVKIFNRIPFLLNNSDQLTLTREHLFAWTFPKNFQSHQLIFHVIEPPKFGILSRKIEPNRNRRIGVSSNFTQQHIDNATVFYKLHFIQYSVVNDFFTFRVITPSVASETIRFDITFIPGLGAIQLINRTIIVDEGGLQKITNETLSLETPDDNSFVFTLGVVPNFGDIIVTRPSGAKFTLSIAMNFTTQDIQSGSVWYEHFGGENRIDRIYLVAESVFRRSSRIPFWMTVQVILKNDNAPELKGNNELQIIDRGDRVLHPSLLPWHDADIDSKPLQFSFYDGFRNAAILLRISPNIHLRNFTQKNLQNGEVLLRHLGHSRRFEMQYTVSDGIHEVASTLTVIASEPFIRIDNHQLLLPHSNSLQLIPLTQQNLSALTNLDVNSSEILFTIIGTQNWILVDNSTQTSIMSFTQQDIDDGKVFYRLNDQSDRAERAMVRAGNLTAVSEIAKHRQKSDSRIPIEMRTLSVLEVPIASLSPIDSQILFTKSEEKSPSEIIYDVIKQPSVGTLVLESFKVIGNDNAIVPSNFYVSRFTQAHVNAGQLQYLHNGNKPSRDSFKFNISIGSRTVGPFTLFINIIDDQIALEVSNVSVYSGGSTVLSTSQIRVHSTKDIEYEYRLINHPQAGWIVLDEWNLSNITSLNSFKSSHLDDHRIFYVNNPVTRTSQDSFKIQVCSMYSSSSIYTSTITRCSDTKKVNVIVKQRNIHGPELVRNEVLKIWHSNKAAITKQYLYSQDDDSPSEQIQYLVNQQPINGYLVRSTQPNRQIFNFSQIDVDHSQIIFVKNESSNVRPESVLFSVSKMPKLGDLMLSDRPVQRFSQYDINERRLSYKPRNEAIDSWSKRDWFQFVVSSNGTANPINEEYRFRISITYAAIPSSRIHELIPRRSINIIPGDSVAVNASHVNLTELVSKCKEDLLVEASRPPRTGLLQFVVLSPQNHTSMISADQLLSGRALIYRNQMIDEIKSDEILFHIYPKSESTKRTNRLRVPLPINFHSPTDPLLKVEKMPDQISIVSGGELELDPNSFQTSHPHIQPSAIIYRLHQTGSNGVVLKIGDTVVNEFTQGDVNKRKVRIHHTQRYDIPDQIDVLVFKIGEHTRTLVADILPLSLSLYNHSDIKFNQGKTYIVLNRSHLGANSNGDRSKIVYNITKPPENGTFYWVAGEKEANSFTQKDIDDERVLYAQLNMQAYQDSFEFALGNDQNDIIYNRSNVIIESVVRPQKLLIEREEPEPITISHLNATVLEGSAPRFLVIDPPKMGRLVMDGNLNESVVFFTLSDIRNGRLFYLPHEWVELHSSDSIGLQLDADGIQPARFRFWITIRLQKTHQTVPPASRAPPPTSSEAPSSPEMAPASYQLPLLILLAIISLTIFILLCRRHSVKQRRRKVVVEQKQREYAAKLDAIVADQPDLLGSTVYATVGRNRPETNPNPTRNRQLQTFDSSLSSSSVISQQPKCRITPLTFSSPLLNHRRPTTTSLSTASKHQFQNSLDHTILARASSSSNISSRSRQPDKLQSTKLKDNQYWV
ncbi:unnamed protein product [Anisakis simplex]|uniref:Chondroitin sulfate proteoglycan 4 (inferred by orthology to a human protein) n=1 Tax=Anisakis simplex TaxID=6269 RepID=A0A0M3K2M4_ANISI|nr:unnamed protein product [Anisakis simplex]